ncbi:type I polyketide synthase [Pseudoalteromonas maricaloris]|uniref:type I polyketide synthase n=1 Tax=Pseudoalteromonas maricaloris TaxID=184924 RepID=UPI000299DEA8|nr:type I polyketide synthase [Pseudoalteromonas flavipulchra]
MKSTEELKEYYQDDIAVISMAGRFPGANSVEEFWHNLENGVESVRFFSQEELLNLGVDPALLENPNFVGAEGVLEGVENFDAEFFGFSPREAELLDPQHRIFLEVIWELLERAGYGAEEGDNIIGVYSGAGASSYLSRNLLSHQDYVRDVGTFKVSLSTGQDFVSTRASYKLGLSGPSININTLCSSSAVAVHYAREALLAYQCDIAVAGGVTISNSREDALFYQEGGIGSFDGHCRAFDARAAGTVAGNGIALVALKRMEDALEDGDQILGVLKSSAINNDGGDKASYTAPSPEGQSRCITEALESAEIDPATISYIEAHGTGTNLGDPIEVSGLTRAFQRYTDKKQFCGIGSVKTNIGHLVSAGGVASMIKTLKGMEHHKIPASLNFEQPNPKIDFANSPFFVVDKTIPWEPSAGDKLRAGISSFGIGGTNAHLIVEEAPELPKSDSASGLHLIVLSAKTASSLVKTKENLLEHLKCCPELNIADVAYTLQVGRRNFKHKFVTVVSSIDELKNKLTGDDKRFTIHSAQNKTERDICFMFPGQGSQYVGMAKALYENEAEFKKHLDQCFELIHTHCSLSLKELLFCENSTAASTQLKQTQNAQLSLFSVSYALAKLLISWDVKPQSMIGHSIGEYVAACLSGVFTLENAIRLVAKRGELMAGMPHGKMLSIPIAASEVSNWVREGVWHCVQNSEHSQVLGGQPEAVDALLAELNAAGIEASLLHTSHAFHSGMMAAALQPFIEFASTIPMNKPTIPFISNVSGDWAEEEVCSPEYWAKHLRQTVKFNDGLETLWSEDTSRVYVEVGPGTTLRSFIKTLSNNQAHVASTLPKPAEQELTLESIAFTRAEIWAAGITLPFEEYYSSQKRHRVRLPTYAFEPKRYWIEPAATGKQLFKPDLILTKDSDMPSTTKPLVEGALRWELKAVEQHTTLSDAQLAAIKAMQQGVTEQLATILGSSMDVKGEGLELKFANIESQIDGSSDDLALASNHSRPSFAPDYVEPRTELESLLAQQWQEVLGYSPVGIEDNFFEMGGHSLMAAALVTKMRKQFEFEIPLQELLQLPTISALSELIETRMWLLEQENSEADTTEPVEVLEL